MKGEGRGKSDQRRWRKDERMIDEGWKRKETKRISSVRELEVYRLAFDTAMEIFVITKSFPKEEKYSLTDQVRRSSRSVCTNLAEAWRKRRYKAVFINKLSDAEQEAAETQTWLEFAWKCNYVNEDTFRKLDAKYEHVFAMLITMERKVDTFCK
jgi:four helix bundle protein